MKKANKILMASVAILLSLVLITTSVVSGVFAKFAIKKNTTTTMKLEKFGVTMEVSAPNSDVTINTSKTVNDGENISVTLNNIELQSQTNVADFVKFKFSGQTTVKTKLVVRIDVQTSEKLYVSSSAFADSSYANYVNKAYMPCRFKSTAQPPSISKQEKYTNCMLSGSGNDATSAAAALDAVLEYEMAIDLYSILNAGNATYDNIGTLAGPTQDTSGTGSYYVSKTFETIGKSILLYGGADHFTFGYSWTTSNWKEYYSEFFAYIADQLNGATAMTITFTVSLEQVS